MKNMLEIQEMVKESKKVQTWKEKRERYKNMSYEDIMKEIK